MTANLGVHYYEQGKYAQAEVLLQRALTGVEHMLGSANFPRMDGEPIFCRY